MELWRYEDHLFFLTDQAVPVLLWEVSVHMGLSVDIASIKVPFQIVSAMAL